MNDNILIERDINLVLERGEGDTHSFVISDESKDSHGTVFRLSGWDISGYSRNPIVTYGHPDINSTDPNVIIGKSTVHMVEGRLVAQVSYDLDNPLAREVKRKVESGFLNMASIRAMVEDGQYNKEEDVVEFTKQRLIDWGIVMHGSNKNAMKKREIARSLNIEIPEQEQQTPLDEDKADSGLLEEARVLIQKNFDNLKKVVK